MSSASLRGLHWQIRHGAGRCPWEGVMHPMFVELFIETDADELAYEEDRRRSSRRVRRAQARAIPRTSAGSRRQPPPRR